MQTPAADVEITVALVERMLRQQHPDLLAPVRPVTNGWDNAVFRLGEHLGVRLPRRQAAAELIRNEHRWLPVLAPRLPVQIPVAVRRGEPDADYPYPYPWSVIPWFEGTDADLFSPEERGTLARELAEFHAALHRPAPTDAPRNPVRGVPLRARDAAVRERLRSGVAHADALAALWRRLVATPEWEGPALWLHGDPHPGNALLHGDPAGRRTGGLAAILDFGDITAGDPATDLAAAWSWFDADGRAAYRDHLHGLGHPATDSDTWNRARGWALNMGTAILVTSDGNPRMAAIGAHTLTQVLLPD